MALRSRRAWKVFEFEIASALVEQRSDEVRRTDLAWRILRRAAGEGEVDGDQGNRGLVYQPGFDAARAHDPLDRGRERWFNKKRKRENRSGGSAPHETPDCRGNDGHVCFSSDGRLFTR